MSAIPQERYKSLEREKYIAREMEHCRKKLLKVTGGRELIPEMKYPGE